MHSHKAIHVHVKAYTSAHTCMCMHTHTCTHANEHMRTHTHVHASHRISRSKHPENPLPGPRGVQITSVWVLHPEPCTMAGCHVCQTPLSTCTATEVTHPAPGTPRPQGEQSRRAMGGSGGSQGSTWQQSEQHTPAARSHWDGASGTRIICSNCNGEPQEFARQKGCRR